MRLLLDTQVVLWWLEGGARLSPPVTAAISSAANAVFVSAASAWEMEIKRALGKLRSPEDLADQLAHHRFLELPVRITHTSTLRRLPTLHRDPFDRLIVAQAIAERLTIVSADPILARYGVQVMRA
jgi:PIN domain nuclease of toxin-antitoxin system